MIYARRINETTGELTIKGSFTDIMDEYKHITDQLLQTHLMSLWQRWIDGMRR